MTDLHTTNRPAPTRRVLHLDRPMQSRAVATRAALVDSAAHVVVAEGPGAGINTILADSGVTKGASYFHFPSKEALVAAIGPEASYRCGFIDEHHARAGVDPVQITRELVLDYVRAAATDEVVRADAILWTDITYGELVRGGVHDRLRAALTTLLSRAGGITITADAVIAVLTGIGARPGALAGFGAPHIARTVEDLLGVILAGHRVISPAY